MNKQCSIIIPTKDKLSRLYLTLKCLEPQVTSEIEVIIVFDGCSESTLKDFSKLSFTFEPICVISQTNIGRAAARNKGLAHANGSIIIFLDDDRLTEPCFIEKHIEHHRARPCVVLGERMDLKYKEEEITSLMNDSSIEKILNQIKRASKKEFYYHIKKIFLKPSTHPLRYLAFITGNVSIDKKLLHQIKGFDENFKGWGYEDTDLGYRLTTLNVPFISDVSIVCYHILHSHVKNQKSKEELINLKYLKQKFSNDYKLRHVLTLYQLKAKLHL